MGEPLFTGPNAQAVVARVLTENARSIRSSRDTVPEWLDAAALKAVAKFPADRFATAAEFADALKGNTAAQTTAHRTQTSPSHTSLGFIRRSAAAAAAIATFVARTALAYFALPKQSANSNELQLARQLTFDGKVSGAVISPMASGSQLMRDQCLLSSSLFLNIN